MSTIGSGIEHRFVFRGAVSASGVSRQLDIARQALSSGDFSTAEKSCLSILETNPNHARALLVLGTVCAKTGRLEEGIDKLRQLVSAEPSCVEALNWLASLYRETGRPREAVETSRRAVAINPRDAESHYNLGLCLKAALDSSGAADAFREATLAAPAVHLYRREWVSMLFRLERKCEAQAAIDLGLDQVPGDPAMRAYRALMLERESGPEPAKEFCRNAYDGDPARQLQLARALTGLDLWRLAEDLLRAVVGQFPRLAAAHAFLGEVLQHCGSFDEARECLAKAIALDPRQVGPFFNYAHRNKMAESDRTTIAVMEEMARDADRSVDERKALHYGIGKALDDLGDYEAAMGHFDSANRLSLHQQSSSQPFNRERFKGHVDRQIQVFTKEFLAENRGIGCPNETPIFIVGMMRSGTTLLKQILSNHPKVGPGSEIRFWAESSHACLYPDDRLDRGRLGKMAAEYLELLGHIAPGYSRVTDKMPHNYLVLGRIHLALPGARIIHCRRHPVDTCLSIWATPFLYSAGYTFDRDNIVFAYRNYLRLMSHWRDVLPPDRFLEVDYEEVVANTETSIRRVLEFCGLDWSDACLRHHENRAVVTSASVWQARQAIYGDSVSRWRHYEPWLGVFRELLPS